MSLFVQKELAKFYKLAQTCAVKSQNWPKLYYILYILPNIFRIVGLSMFFCASSVNLALNI